MCSSELDVGADPHWPSLYCVVCEQFFCFSCPADPCPGAPPEYADPVVTNAPASSATLDRLDEQIERLTDVVCDHSETEDDSERYGFILDPVASVGIQLRAIARELRGEGAPTRKGGDGTAAPSSPSPPPTT